MHKIDFYNRIYIMKRLPSEIDCQNRYRLPDGSQGVATCASRQGNYRLRLAHVFASLFLPYRIFIIKRLK